MFAHHRGKHFSLLDMAAFLYRDFRLKITKQSLHLRFNGSAVRFLKSFLDLLISQKIRYRWNASALKSKFNRIRIKNSTKFVLPASFSGKYKGYGGALHNSSSMISIQYEYDFPSGQSLDLRLTEGVLNDQSNSSDFTHDIREGDLFLRDLGYCTLKFMSMVDSADAFFVNRLAPKTNVYADRESKDPVDVSEYLHKLKKYGLELMEVEVFLGKKERLPVRAVVSLTDEETYQKDCAKRENRPNRREMPFLRHLRPGPGSTLWLPM
jgi:hypothetical protein